MGRPGLRIGVLILVTWVPLLVLTAAAGTLVDGTSVPFLRHLGSHARFLGSIPLLLIAEILVHDRMVPILNRFRMQNLLPAEAVPAFDESLRSSRRLADSILPEILFVLLAVTGGHWLWASHVAMPMDTWYGRMIDGQRELSPAGHWYAFVSLPIARFLLYRWYFRVAIWYRLLWRISRLPLNLNPLHPDRAAGIGFLSDSIPAFAPLLVAHTVLLSGVIGDSLLHLGTTLHQYKVEIGAIVIGLILITLVPLLFFSSRLARERRRTLREYGILSAKYVDDFRERWIRRADPPSALGSPDIQSLADLGGSFDVVRETRLAPISKRSVASLAAMVVLPLLPLVLTLVPLEEVVDRLLRLLV